MSKLILKKGYIYRVKTDDEDYFMLIIDDDCGGHFTIKSVYLTGPQKGEVNHWIVDPKNSRIKEMGPKEDYPELLV
jgi:hypothetical protein